MRKLWLVVLFVAGAAMAQEKASSPYQVNLLGRSYVPPAGISSEVRSALKKGDTERIHVVLQFNEPLKGPDFKYLADAGIRLQGYLGGRSYHASIPRGLAFEADRTAKMTRAAFVRQPSDKLKPDVARRSFEEWAVEKGGKQVKLLTEFFPDVPSETIRKEISRLEIAGQPYGAPNVWALLVDVGMIEKLAALDIVKTISTGPVPFMPLNRGSRRLAATDAAQLATYDTPQPGFEFVSGDGIKVAICDSGVDENHDDFDAVDAAGAAGASRVYNTTAGSGSHGTHVASIAAGSGLNSASNGFPGFSLAGHAPQAMVGDYGQAGSSANSFSKIVLTDKSNVSNHSYVQTSSDFYDGSAVSLDTIVRGDATDTNGNKVPHRPQVWAAGNNGTSAQYGNEEGYYSVFTTAKNTISVGSLDTRDGRVSDYSSLGPTFDGRIKPDVVAPGCNDSIAAPSAGIAAADDGTQAYTGKCGTSMAAPAVTGILATMMEAYTDATGASVTKIRPSTFKAILVATADDREKPRAYPDREFNSPDTGKPLRYHAGPDFSTGFGLVDASQGRALIADVKRWKEASVASEGDVDTYCISVPAGTEQLKVVLAWDDEPGDSSTSETTPKLVNNLDLTLTEPGTGTVYQPWTLDPLPLTATPGDGSADPIALADLKPAYRGVDDRNNVEMASVFLPAAGTWRVRVKAKSLPNGNTQRYSLAASHQFRTYCGRGTLCQLFPWICVEAVVDVVLDPGVKFVDGDRFVIVPNDPVPVDRICQYVIDCPGCDGPGWSYCPGFRIEMDELPPDVVVTLITSEGEVMARDAGGAKTRVLTADRITPGDEPFLLFTDAKNEPYGKELMPRIRVGKTTK